MQLNLPTPDGGSFTLSVVHHGFSWKPEEFGPLLFCEGQEAPDLANQYRTYGLGVPLIATRQAMAPEDASGLYPQGASFPVTAFFRFDGDLSDLVRCHVGRLELYNPLAAQTVEVFGKRVPLETDLTTPLAYFLSHTDLDKVKYTGFLRPDTIQQREGIYMLEPYQPGKIPVLMVHGLLSSPTTWLPMFNDLRADPVLRERYQFWFWFYPTSNPYIVTAADLRDNLHRLRARVDPRHQDRAFDQLVLVGHSMGGLISHLLTVDSGDDFWKLVSDQPLDRLKLREESELELRRVFYFQREPWVKRVVFLGTPHHGSRLSPGLPGQLADYVVRLPKAFMAVTQDLVTENKNDLAGIRLRSFPTSVDLLAPGAPALELLAARPPAEAVHFHSIVGVAPPNQDRLERWLAGDSCEPGDGVVPYRSAHLDNVDSEQVVCADHFNVHRHPLAVLEVRRILMAHLRAVDDPPTGIQQVTASPGPAAAAAVCPNVSSHE
jgi:pimeloyl-ACP methyl ester carboxylesterase